MERINLLGSDDVYRAGTMMQDAGEEMLRAGNMNHEAAAGMRMAADSISLSVADLIRTIENLTVTLQAVLEDRDI